MKNKSVIREFIQEYGPDAKALILLEHERQVKDCVEWYDSIKGQKRIIALSPFAIYALDRQSLPYKIPEDYYDAAELCHLGLDNYQKIEAFCSLIDKGIHKAWPVIAERGIRPALFSLYHLKIAYDAATVRLFQLSHIIDAEKPDIIFVYDDRDYRFGTSEKAPYLLFDNRESVYTRLLKLKGWKVPVTALPYIPQSEETYALRKSYQGVTSEFRNKLARWLSHHPKLYDLAVDIQNKGWKGFFIRLKDYLLQNKNMPVLVFSGGQYSWNDCREELQSAGIAPIFTMPDNLGHWLSKPLLGKVGTRDLPDVWQELQGDGEFRRFFVWQDIDFFPVLEERLQFLMERLTLACLKAYEEVAEILRNRGIKAFLASGLSTCTSHSAAQAACSAGIPVIVWQHGSYGYSNQPLVIYNEMTGADAFFVFGEGVIEKYAETARHLGTKLVAVGSASLDALGRKSPQKRTERLIPLNPERKVVLYVTTNFYQNNLYISLPPPFSDNHFWHTQRQILNVLARHKGYTIVVKLHPAYGYRDTPLHLYAREKGFEGCHFIKDECSFKDLLPIADVLVIDWPMTVLLEALTTSKPVFVYTGHLHIDDQAQELLKRRAFCHRKLDDFLDVLGKFLSGGTMDLDLNDTEFLKKFGIANGTSGVRAAAALMDIIQKEGNQT
jgi:hypothetical protein